MKNHASRASKGWELFSEGRLTKVKSSRWQWMADLRPLNGPVLGPFSTEHEAMIAEQEWHRLVETHGIALSPSKEMQSLTDAYPPPPDEVYNEKG